MSVEHKRKVDHEAEPVKGQAAGGASDAQESIILGPVTKPGGTGEPAIAAASISAAARE